MKPRLFITMGMLLVYAILLFVACDNNNSASPFDERTAIVPTGPNDAAMPIDVVKISLLGDFFSNEEGCFWMIVGDSGYYELAFETIGPPRFNDGTSVLVTGEYATRLGSNCGAQGPIVSVEEIEPVPEETTSGEETNVNDF